MFVVLTYVSAIVIANLSVATFGPAVTPINAFFLIGLDLTLRDVLHARWQDKQLVPKMLGLLAVAGAISYLLNPATGIIALASTAAFVLSNAIDGVVYQAMRDRPYLQKANTSNAVGAAVDSVVFPTIAFGALMPEIAIAQFAAKFLGGAFWAYSISKFKVA